MNKTESTTWLTTFLKDFDPRSWNSDENRTNIIKPQHDSCGNGDNALEVASKGKASRQPKADELRAIWLARQGKRPSPRPLIEGYPSDKSPGTRVSVCGPNGDSPPIYNELLLSQIENICAVGFKRI